jgi:hypothetical protein
MMCMCCYKHQMELRVQDTVQHMKVGLRNKVDMAKSNITTIRTLVFEWCVVRSRSTNRHQKTRV